jgi:hypothetical protein
MPIQAALFVEEASIENRVSGIFTSLDLQDQVLAIVDAYEPFPDSSGAED